MSLESIQFCLVSYRFFLRMQRVQYLKRMNSKREGQKKEQTSFLMIVHTAYP